MVCDLSVVMRLETGTGRMRRDEIHFHRLVGADPDP
jgi:hypothetical protein